jgi:hypothetical protein
LQELDRLKAIEIELKKKQDLVQDKEREASKWKATVWKLEDAAKRVDSDMVEKEAELKRFRFANCELLQKVGKLQDELKDCRNALRKENDNKEEKVEKTAGETGTQKEVQCLMKRVEVLEKKVADIEELKLGAGQVRGEKEEGTEDRKEKEEEGEISTRGRMNKEEKGKEEPRMREISEGKKVASCVRVA